MLSFTKSQYPFFQTKTKVFCLFIYLLFVFVVIKNNAIGVKIGENSGCRLGSSETIWWAAHKTNEANSNFFPASLNHYTPAEDHQTKLERLTGGAITATTEDSKSNGDKTEIASKLQAPSSHLHDALVKEEDDNSSDNVEKPPKRRKIKREIIRPDPKYKGKSIKFRTYLVFSSIVRLYVGKLEKNSKKTEN